MGLLVLSLLSEGIKLGTPRYSSCYYDNNLFANKFEQKNTKTASLKHYIDSYYVNILMLIIIVVTDIHSALYITQIFSIHHLI